ncbi:HNH endonuclease [Streptomyces sp. NPDC020377]|uniref:HNH endonuclease n=1 Tax=Streptomyces sp. NPDC020377 TaxID=3365070 RepID=UPI0037B194F9
MEIYHPLGRQQKFCSKQCHDRGQRANRVVTVCAACGDRFSHRRSSVRKYCSKACDANGRMVRVLDREHNGRPARINAAGYVMIWEPDHPACYDGWLLEHRLVAERTLGRRLETADEVHHINRDKTDNRPENLVVLSGPDHSYITALDNWRDLKELKSQLARYRELYGDLPEE